MQHIFDIHDYDENFAERFCSHTIPIYDLWSVRPLQNQMKEIISGSAEEVEKFRNFLVDHANKDYPHELVIVIGNSEKGNPGNMLNSTKKYFKLRFDKYKGNDLGQPLFMGGVNPYPTGTEQMIPLGFPAVPGSRLQGTPGMPGISYTEIQGIIDRNVNDATRSIRAEYEENLAKRETESIKRIAELEMKMEFYKLDLRAREIEEREKRLQEDEDELAERKAEGLGSVKEYTKTIAGGLLELGKSAFGIDEIENRVSKAKKFKNKESENDNEKSEKRQNLRGAGSFDDSSFTKVSDDKDGFSTKSITKKQNPENGGNEDAFSELLGVIQTLSVEQRMQLMDVLIPEEETSDAEALEDNENSNLNNQNHEEVQSGNHD